MYYQAKSLTPLIHAIRIVFSIGAGINEVLCPQSLPLHPPHTLPPIVTVPKQREKNRVSGMILG
jgi:hypothetical protein